MNYPSLYKVADAASLKAQNKFLRLTMAHAVLLVIGTALAINVMPNKLYSIIMALVFLLALGLSILLGIKKYEKTWYNGRAVAESIKTSTWRYCMRASPFENADAVQIPKTEFRNLLNGIIKANRELGEAISEHEDTGGQITDEMNEVRSLCLEQRKDYYLKFRVDEQRLWYTKKAAFNKKKQRHWFVCLISTQLLAILCVLLRIAYPEWNYWPTDVLVVMAAFVIGWMQIKKFNELSSAYSLTAQEIGIIRGLSEDVQSDGDLSSFVINSEQAFSREHTQWSARQNS
ncbi:DUF4231 domain-containing protein [Pseudoalteromonas sp. MMG012]|uniref:DUF4231 domain-containing protein n=1 Tax=Pseudoalteromonas sp. MMG012 TaxID=2822686 RepID=UPI001B3A2B50|nr:DUF4231 domain-containing protein [Pseudoalteromonas sp. MMG012]MBQ4851405.1 DUF4231 domain-containing protein [Pseudoalteromonas sp. MMG012]